MIVGLAFVVVQCRNALRTVLFLKAVCEQLQQLIGIIEVWELFG